MCEKQHLPTLLKSSQMEIIPYQLSCGAKAALPWCHSQSPMSPSYGTNETCENTDVHSARKCLINQKYYFRYVWLHVFRHLLMTDLQVANTSNTYIFKSVCMITKNIFLKCIFHRWALKIFTFKCRHTSDTCLISSIVPITHRETLWKSHLAIVQNYTFKTPHFLHHEEEQ